MRILPKNLLFHTTKLWFDPNNDCAENNASNDSLSAQINSVGGTSNCARDGKRPINPYRQVSGSTTAGGSLFYQNGIDDPMNDSFRHGFPVVGSYYTWVMRAKLLVIHKEKAERCS